MQRKTQKWIGVLFLLSLITFFMDILKISVLNMSLFDVVKVFTTDYVELEEVADLVDDYVGVILIVAIVGLMLAILVSSIWVFCTKSKNMHISVIALSALYSVIEFYIVWTIRSKLDSAIEALSLFGMEDLIRLKMLPILLWIAIYGVIIGLTILDMREYQAGSKAVTNTPIMPEEFFGHKNPWDNPQPFTVMGNKGEEQSADPSRPFHGALIGRNGIHNNKAYLLPEMELVFVEGRDQSIEIMEEKSTLTIASIYFVDEYQEYCVRPENMRQVFLESGQPLGMNRDYYLPRGTRVYFQNRKKLYELA